MPNLSDITINQLISAAKAACQNSYSIYSDYAVGAALLTVNGQIFTGTNVENAAYPAGICAERVAISNAITQGIQAFEAIALYSPKGDISPCGMCRQFIHEFGQDILVVFRWEGVIQQKSVSQLLPYSFCKAHLSE